MTGTHAWLVLSRKRRPLPGRPCAVLLKGKVEAARAYWSRAEDDAGLHIACDGVGVTFNVDLDERKVLPSHFVQLPSLPKRKRRA